MNYEQLVEQCKQLRAQFERDEARFLIALVRIEQTSMSLLKENGCVRFAQFLKTHHLCDVTRYERFSAGLAIVGVEAAEQIGAEAVCKAAQTTTPEAAARFVEAAQAFRELNGVAPRGETVTRLLQNTDPRATTPRVVKSTTEINRLREENAQLRGELREARKRIRSLERQLTSGKSDTAALSP